MADTLTPQNSVAGNLQVTTPNDLDIVMVREFNAPADLVYQALTRPELVQLWFAPEGWTFAQCDIDLRVGGDWRFVTTSPDGTPLGTSGKYTELTPHRIAFTKQFDDYPGETLVSTVLTEQSGKTHLTTTVHYTSQPIRDAVLQHGWTPFYIAAFDNLDGVLNSRKGLTMIDAPQILTTSTQKVAKIHLTVPSSEIRTHMGAGLKEVRQVLADQGVKASGAWLTHHFTVPDQTFDFEICVPVDQDITPQGRVTAGELRVTKAARTVYRGDYSGLGQGWGEFMGWIRDEALPTAGDFWEVYSVGPDDSANPSDWQTELTCPLV